MVHDEITILTKLFNPLMGIYADALMGDERTKMILGPDFIFGAIKSEYC